VKPRVPAAPDGDEMPAHLANYDPADWPVEGDWMARRIAWLKARSAWQQEHPPYSAARRERYLRDYFDLIRKDST
jgi:hypothetical protein